MTDTRIALIKAQIQTQDDVISSCLDHIKAADDAIAGWSANKAIAMDERDLAKSLRAVYILELRKLEDMGK